MSKGYTHIYTGNGKGKTTAAFGVAVRMLMIGKRVYVGQFIKGMKYSETRLTEYFETLTCEQYGLECFIEKDPEPEDFERAKEGYRRALEIVTGGKFDLVVLDEIFIAYYFKMLSEIDIVRLIDQKHEATELILTGRYCPEGLYNHADLVTEMKEIKH
jgi:cob(I)alamin adenosyltransferase